MDKKKFIPLFALLLIGTVFAGAYIVNSLIIKTDVYEPFDVSYAILGDGGNWNQVDTCSGYDGEWASYKSGTEIDVDGLFAGEGRKVCIKIVNAGEGDIPYEISNEILNTNEAIRAKCDDAFGEHSLTGVADGESETRDGIGIIVSTSAEPVDDCRVKINVARTDGL